MVSIDGTDAGDFSFTTDCNNPLDAAATCTVDVTFSPTATGARSATLHLVATPGGEATASLTGMGMMSSGAVFSITPKTFAFDDTPEGTAGNSNTFTITNTGGSASPALTSSTIVGGMTGSYSITTDGCFAKILAPNDTCMVTVQFKPAAAGMQSSTLTVAGTSATLSGRGIGTFQDELNTNGGPGAGTFWYGAAAPAVDELVGTATTGTQVYFGKPGMPATFTAYNSGATSGAQLYGVWGPSKGSVYTVDNKGEVLHWGGGGTAFTLFNFGNIIGGGCCSGIWGFSDTDIYVVGNTSAAHYNGNWSAQTVSASITVALNAVWGSATNNVYAVGKSGLILYNNGSGTWTQQTSGTTADLYAIYGSGANDIYAVGFDATPTPVILHYNGLGWTTQTSGVTSGKFYSVWVAPDGEAWVADILGAILHSNGNGMWTNMSPGGGEKWQVTGTSDHDVYVFGEDGHIYHYY